VEFAGYVEGTANVVSELVVVDRWRSRPREWICIAQPGIRIQIRIAQILVSRGVKLGAAAPSENPDLRAGGAAVFCGIIRRHDLPFLRGVHVRGSETRSVGTRAGGRSTVKGDQVLRVARSVEVCRPLTETEG